MLGIPKRGDRLIETDRSLDPLLKFGVVDQVPGGQRLFYHQQTELIKLLE